MLKRKERWDPKLNPRNVNFFPGDITEKRRSTFSASFHKLCPGIKTPKKDEHINLGSPLGPKSQADSLEKKINELEKVNGIVEKLDALCGFVMLKNCFSFPKLLYVMSIAVGNTFRQLSAKCAGYHVSESRLARYGNRQIGVGNKRCAELVSNVFRYLIENPQPKENVILKVDFENAFNSINRQFMLEKISETHPEDYKYSHSAYSQPSFLFFTVIQ